ncbi:MAG: TRAP transporter small permease subunit [Guyparkeria sp.]|uniref:TRAP transporter small permease subunit n=1 Tax=Guyparkeria sp. TaxID=2035736 RepID=UPI00397BC1A2
MSTGRDTPALSRLVDRLDRVNEWTGRVSAWLGLVLALTVFAVVALRYGFNDSDQWLSESIYYWFALMFMLGMGYTYRHDGHVRVDVLARKTTPRRRAWIEIVGVVLLLWPACLFIALSSLDYVGNAWAIREGSPEPGGIPLLYLLKTLLIVMPALLFWQGLVELLRSVAVLRGETPTRPSQGDLEEGM